MINSVPIHHVPSFNHFHHWFKTISSILLAWLLFYRPLLLESNILRLQLIGRDAKKTGERLLKKSLIFQLKCFMFFVWILKF